MHVQELMMSPSLEARLNTQRQWIKWIVCKAEGGPKWKLSEQTFIEMNMDPRMIL
jgi:hypothetical protein